MNPYTIPLFAIPAGITIAASLLKNKAWKWILLLLATFIFWGLLQPSVHWAYTHPFNPNDGGPKTFAFLFGWAYGLIIIVVPTYWISKGIQHLKKIMKQGNSQPEP
jgi:zinc transporter ZupT